MTSTHFGAAFDEGVEFVAVGGGADGGEDLVATAGIGLHEREADAAICAGDQDDGHALRSIRARPGPLSACQRVGTGLSPR